ncbi:pyruvate, water dikinase regulatory protein [Clostridium saccharobutylicum]|uniref:Putative pyruvate, phosphate dikinase regulatory protein n=1 Tax=Clostridium saccharobutylicum TaxID=169679 RepID=A0A1S8NDH8_CLOSA|nr:pyruvate, water dikinase regulatory protein [Clostridium saccharobutylicum]OOM14453.1 putative pyruvate, phosphate dikinase regulatory protein [Clostridium saccharobutylicum]
MITIFAVSDSVGETAEMLAKAVAIHFKNNVEIKIIPFVKSLKDVDNAVQIFEKSIPCIVTSTIVSLDIMESLTKMCYEKNITLINLLEPIIKSVESMMNVHQDYKPGALRVLDSIYFKRIEAMEFAIKYDDARDYSGIEKADVVIVGLSRTSKTPLCMYLANKGIKAVNIPLAPEVEVPKELFNISPKKIFGLTVDPLRLIDIRKKRINGYTAVYNNIQYYNDARILEELEFSDKVMRKLNCRVIDVSKIAIEETALIIMNALGYKDNL